MVFAISIFELHLPGARSLKDKRRVVKALIERIHQRYRVSIIESDFHDLHQRAQIALAAVHSNDREMGKMLDAIRATIDDQHEAVLASWDPQLLEAEP